MLFEIEFTMCFLELPKTKGDKMAIYNDWRGDHIITRLDIKFVLPFESKENLHYTS